MGTRGRKSAAAMTTVVTSPLETIERQRPPHDLSDEEVEVWAAVVDTEPADWFSPTTAPILAEYCRHVIHARRVAELLERAVSDIDPVTKQSTLSIKDYDRLLKMQDRESRAISSLATKMRISQQSTINQRGNKTVVPQRAKKLWEG